MVSLDTDLLTAIQLDLLKIGAIKPVKVQVSLSHYSFSCGQANIARSLPPSLKSKAKIILLSQIHFFIYFKDAEHLTD